MIQKENILLNLSVGIPTVSQSTTFNDTIENLHKQKYQPKNTIVVKDICPVYKAMEEIFKQATTEYIVILDDDVTFIKDDALQIMLTEIQSRSIDEVIFRLQDSIFGEIIGIKIYKTESIKNIVNKLKGGIWRDVSIHKVLEEEKKSYRSNTVIGDHHKVWSGIDLYWKMYTSMKKLSAFEKDMKIKWINRYLETLTSALKHTDTITIMYGISGMVDGLRDKTIFPYLSYENKFNNKLFEELKEGLNQL